jgi:Transposase and inactivated derivatives
VPSNRSKYTQEFRDQTAQFILENGKSATSAAEEMGIDINTVCRWVREYRRQHGLPSYQEEKGIVPTSPKSDRELLYENRRLEKELKKKEKAIQEEREKIEILKKSLRIFMQPIE